MRKNMRKKVSGSFLLFILAAICSVVLAVSAHASEEMLNKAAAELKARNYLKAKDLYREAYISAKNGPLADSGLFGLAKTEYLLKNYSEAVLHLKRYAAKQDAPQRNEALAMLGYAYFFQNRLAEADRTFSTVGGGEASRALIGRAEVALQNNQAAAAESLISRVDRTLVDTDSRAIYVQAMLLAKKGMGDQAVAMINRVPLLVLREQDLRVERAVVYLLGGKSKEAITLLNSFLASPLSGMEQARTRRALVLAYELTGKPDEMLKTALELLQFDSSDELRRKVIVAYDRKGDLESALKQASQLRDRGLRSLEVEKKLKKAIEADTPKTVDLVQRFAFYLHAESPMLATCATYLAQKGKKLESRNLLQKAVKGTGATEASLALAELYVQEARYEEAAKLVQPLVGSKQHGQSALLLLADIADRKGDTQGAIALLQKTQKAGKSGKQPRLELRLGDLAWKSGDRTGAIKHYTAAADAGEVDAMVKVADAQYLTGQNRLAEKYYQKALSRDLKDARQKQWVQYQYGKLTGNRESLEKAAAAGGEVGEAARIYLNR